MSYTWNEYNIVYHLYFSLKQEMQKKKLLKKQKKKEILS